MFISKKKLSRRQLLRGTGTAVSLPLLDAMLPALTAQAATAANITTPLGGWNDSNRSCYRLTTSWSPLPCQLNYELSLLAIRRRSITCSWIVPTAR